MATRMIGAVLYEGPSELDGAPIVVVMTGFQASANRKTGKMLHTWIMRADVDPAKALVLGRDVSICGECPQRRNKGGSCYVIPEQAPLQIWRTWKEGRYEDWTGRFPDNALKDRSIRFGAYGDPAAVPFNVWRRVREQKISGWTGYTHQWRHATNLRPFLMASVDSEEELVEAHAAGWRTFRVRDEIEPALMSEVICPSERVTCKDCNLCRGSSRIAKSIVIVAHGFLVSRRKRRTLAS